jgi:hypothetical protein
LKIVREDLCGKKLGIKRIRENFETWIRDSSTVASLSEFQGGPNWSNLEDIILKIDHKKVEVIQVAHNDLVGVSVKRRIVNTA